MASIEKRQRGGRASYRVHYRTADKVQRSKSFRLKREADAYLTEVTSSVQTGNYVDPSRGRVTLGTVADDWLATKVSIRPTTRARYESAIEKHVRPKWGTTPVARITHEDLQQWVADLVATGAQPGQVQKVISVTSGMLSKAVRDRRLASNPAHGLDLPSGGVEKRVYLTAAQVDAMAKAAGDGRVVVKVLAYCGLRWSELAGLRVSCVNLERRRLEIVETAVEVNGGRLVYGAPKSGERRSVPVPAFLVDELRTIIDGKVGSDLVFTTRQGNPLRNRNARRSWFNDAAEAIGEPDLTPHSLRHTCASLAVSSGANVLSVARMLGHSDPSVTLRIYADLFDSDLDAVGDALNKLASNQIVSQSLPKAKNRSASGGASSAPKARKR